MIYKLNTPLEVGRNTVEYMNIFKLELETQRPDATIEPRIDVFLAACDENGTELIAFSPEGKETPVAAAFERLDFAKLTDKQKLAHKAMMAAVYEFLHEAGFLGDGEVINA